jgi:hypothetical protein
LPGFGSDWNSNASIAAAPPWYTQILPCAKSHWGLTTTAAGFDLAGVPVSKNLVGVSANLLSGASLKTSLIRALAFKAGLGDLEIGVKVFGTKSLAGIIGRGAGAWISAGLFSIDAYQIGSCVVNGDWSGLPH